MNSCLCSLGYSSCPVRGNRGAWGAGGVDRRQSVVVDSSRRRGARRRRVCVVEAHGFQSAKLSNEKKFLRVRPTLIVVMAGDWWGDLLLGNVIVVVATDPN